MRGRIDTFIEEHKIQKFHSFFSLYFFVQLKSPESVYSNKTETIQIACVCFFSFILLADSFICGTYAFVAIKGIEQTIGYICVPSPACVFNQERKYFLYFDRE